MDEHVSGIRRGKYIRRERGGDQKHPDQQRLSREAEATARTGKIQLTPSLCCKLRLTFQTCRMEGQSVEHERPET